ncbi:kinase-like domain-containing protein [Xylogone sp. PMI_703]|nr:kinase-like domain-containing protein [Xylogone sp. PMI_703]
MGSIDGAISPTEWPRPSRLGLQDQRVSICEDRGEKFFYQDYPPKAPRACTKPVPPDEGNQVISSIGTELDEALQPYPANSIHSHFLPRNKFQSIMTAERVFWAISGLKCCEKLTLDEKNDLARAVCIGGQKWYHLLIQSKQYFALKRLHTSDEDSFNKELASLLSFQGHPDTHLIRLLVTFEVRGGGNGMPTFYLVFPWAQGDLWHFWKMYQAPSDRFSRCVWMAEQCYGLGRALGRVHNDREEHLKRLNDFSNEDHDLYGRHGDVKADNVLYFEKEDKLVISDFGLGRLHTKISRSNQDPKALDKTATYRAPEFDTIGGKISRASDIFSLGCMFLEFLTWYLLGWEDVSESFSRHRMEKDKYGFESDTFFRIEETPTGITTPILKPGVVEWIWKLRQSQYCNQYILDFLDLIEKRMLHPDSRKRIKSAQLVHKLQLYVDSCRTDSEYYKEQRTLSPPE